MTTIDDSLPLEEQFQAAAAWATGDAAKGKFTNDEMASLYAHYKQVTIGPNPNSMPKSIFSPAEIKKHGAWKALGNMDKDAAMKAYVELVKSKMG